MEFEFGIDVVGNPTAWLSMEHELFATWLVEMMSDSKSHEFQQLLNYCQDSKKGVAVDEYKQVAAGYALQISDFEVTLLAGSDPEEQDATFMESEHLQLMESSYSSQCGLEDFADMFVEWHEFVVNI